MGFFKDNVVIEFFHRFFRKPGDILMWLFTGLIVTSTLYLILAPFPSDFGIDNNIDNSKKGKKRL
ncbi:similar to Saccharomyces cerevisiae YBL039W-B Putative protein of unknown function [Maudiozyma barnettii]|uniref:Uncharacterized protein n=1 Tax=Maudiozyma barnettii TaxID=61262 RepID=A0A8H2VGC4_9SACH|nr:Min6p [Kazachstania barnettii]CAB4254982.1 similar to Saccharomyces cerevisiae YBL039W-B Putative protein of unknown function [Kazachstania barnettii]CAD1783253.1 similar to Saccharomyces cerevisiae YBL039W-B Putative protein of unknown function [Kazachstania barnettii]